MSEPAQDHADSATSETGSWHRRPVNRNVAHVANLFFVGVGLFFFIGGYNQWAQVQPVSGGATTTGSIVSVTNGESCGRYGCSPNWTPTIKFETSSGSSSTFTGPTYSSQINVGQMVTVSYLPSDPSIAHDISASSNEALWLIGIGIFAIVLGVGSFVLGFGALHRRLGLSSARMGTGWVGHKYIHSNQNAVVALAALLALVVVGIFII